jgi:acetyltransferase-like isoleucine patch superfamily enzyme
MINNLKKYKFIVECFVFCISFKNYIVFNYLVNIPFHWFRILLIKINVNKLGHNCSILKEVEIRIGKNVEIGNNCVLNKSVLLDGRGGKLIIGNNVDIGQETNIWTLEHNVNDDYHTSNGNNVFIEDYVWIASRVTILPGVIIGKGAVIACNSVVTKNVGSMQIVGGVPAKQIGTRTSELKYNLKYQPWFE